MDWGATTALITGGTGSLGSALSQRFAALKPRRLAIYSRDWHKQSALRRALGDPSWVRWFIGDVRDRDRLFTALRGVDVVIHAAAIKDVLACQYNPREALFVNTVGTLNVVETAIERGVEKVLLISTDKMAEAVNAYGRSKALAESIAIASNAYAGAGPTRISVARYGNVLGSSGSVVPLFMEQAKTGRVTLTDKRMTRFWVTMDQAVSFVLDCVGRMRGGEVYVPKLPSMRVTQMAQAIAPGCEQVEIGIRPGEKLHETLIPSEEGRHTRDCGDYYVVEPEYPFWGEEDSQGVPVPKDFSYTSDANSEWLSVEQLREMVFEKVSA